MRRGICFWIVLVFCFIQNGKSQQFTALKGRICSKEKTGEVQLMKVRNGVPVEYAGTTIAPSGSFAFLFEAEPHTFYYLCQDRSYLRVFVKAGEEIQVRWEDEGWKFTEAGNVENGYLAKWEEQKNKLRAWSKEHDYGAFFPYFESVRKEALEWSEEIKRSGEEFAGELQTIIRLDLLDIFIGYLAKKQQSYESEEQQSAYYQQIIRKFPVADESILSQPYGMALLRNYFSYKHSFVIRREDYSLEQRLAEIDSPVVKAEYILAAVDTRSFKDFLIYERKYFPFLQNAEQRFRLSHFPGRPQSSLKKGEAAFNFIFQDTSGQYRSMADFPGKYKYIDIWATWCAPCKQEIPYLRQLEKKLGDKKIEFISISIDKNRKKWEEFVRKEKLGGIQLWAGGWEAFPEELHLGSVPRFLLLDADGNWVDANAARPSDEALLKLLKNLLGE